AFLFVRDSVVSIDTVKGSSMSPSLSASAHESGEHDRVRIRRGKATRNLRRGDIVTFWKPHKPDEISIKRIVGVEGDIVYPKRGYADGAVVVPYGHVWVEGDNWRKSFDSNDFGPISKALIDGKATRVWRGW
ncbi:LexA/Signal peptidase, partial [Lojkania enalia]